MASHFAKQNTKFGAGEKARAGKIPESFILMGNAGIEPAAFPMWTERSTTELIAQIHTHTLSYID